MINMRSSGTCAYCGEESDRLFDSPLLIPDKWDDVEIDGDHANWLVPHGHYRSKDQFDVVTVGSLRLLRPYEAPAERICWECFGGMMPPDYHQFCVNAPVEVRFNGWLPPEWVDLKPGPRHFDIANSVSYDTCYGCAHFSRPAKNWCYHPGFNGFGKFISNETPPIAPHWCPVLVGNQE